MKNIFKNYKYKKNLIAYSGGLDSTILIYLFIKNKKKIRAIHIDHHQNETSYIFTQHCKKTCKKKNINLIIKNIYIKNIQKYGFESIARKLRYKKIIKCLKKKEIIITGHHENDNIETIILSIKRGSGPLGLSGIKKIKKFKKSKIFRPLIKIKKKYIYKLAKKKNINYINDKSNENIKYDRNFIRKKILPIIKKRWPYFKKNILKTSKLCNEQNILLKYFIKKEIKNIIIDYNKINIFKIKYMNKIILKNILIYWIKKNTKIIISKKIIKNIKKNIIFNKKKIYKKINIKNFEIRKHKKIIYITKKNKNKIKKIYWNKTKIPLILPYNLGFLILDKKKNKKKIKKKKKNKKINIRFYKKGKFNQYNSKKKINIKKIWKKFNIPTWERKNIPIIFNKNKFIKIINKFNINKFNINKKIFYISWKK
ncbi:tRNA lysidine(34) synthetase TilS [Buchnera aphidicola]|uniref:tRNA lysidine(34) synthetase TilS n=1 Tax=Buchnera aphidicola TaxID=9 RepID=UPI0031B88EDB